MKNDTDNKNENFNIGMAQISCQAGDLAGNTEKIINSIKQFEQSRKMMKQMSGMMKGKGKMGKFKLPFGF